VVEAAATAGEANEERVILVNLSGHGYFDMQAYDDYLNGRLPDFEFDPAEEDAALADLPDAPGIG
jgi:tryptophan synthase beta chain